MVPTSTVYPWRQIPWSILLCTAALIALGTSGIARGDEINAGTDFLDRQLVWIVLALPVLFLSTTINYRRFAQWSYWLFGLALILLVAVYFFRPVNGARRWIPLGFFSFQPSELAKLAYILALAAYLRYRENHRRLLGLCVPFLLTLVPVGLILKEPNLGTSLLFFPMLQAMLFAAGARPRHLIAAMLVGLASLPLLWGGMSAEQRSRITTIFLQQDGGPAPRGDSYHLHQSKQMLAMGGIWGAPLAEAVDDPLVYHLPESRTDFVFCMVGERFGLAGCLATLLIYLLLIGRGLMIAEATRDPFGRLVAVGIVTLLGTQVVINTGMTVGLAPITGLTLPLMSYGGTSLLATCLEIGILINIGMRPGYEMTGDPFRFDDD